MISGVWDRYEVYIDGQRLLSDQSRALSDHAPDGALSWGYNGFGCSQTSLALLLYFGATDNEALSYYRDFKADVIAELPQADFEVENSKVIDWLQARRLFDKGFGE